MTETPSNADRYAADARAMTRDRLEGMYEACVLVAHQLMTKADAPRALTKFELFLKRRAPRHVLESAYVAAHTAMDVVVLPHALALPIVGARR